MKLKKIIKISFIFCFVIMIFCITGCSNGQLTSSNHEHVWVLDSKVEAKCIEDGFAIYHCSECSETKIDVLKKEGHKEEVMPAVEPTCSEVGFTQGVRCSVCGEILQAQETIEKLEHNFEENKCLNCPYIYYSEGLLFNLIDDVKGYSVELGSCVDSEIYIPETYNGKPVFKIADFGFYDCIRVKKLVIPDSITSIGTQAFKNCFSLTNMIIPDSVTEIGEGIFDGCRNLKSLELPFLNLNLEKANEGKKYYFGQLFGKEEYAGGISINQNNNTFYIPENLSEVTISSGRISDYAFQNCEQLTTVTLKDGVISIGRYAFNSCENLNKVYLPKMIKEIGNGVFSWCTKLKECYFDGTIEDWCNVVLKSEGSNPMIYEQSLFFKYDNEWVQPTEIELSNKVTSIGDYQFYNYKSLEKIIFSNTLTKIGTNAFEKCENLKDVYFDGTIENWYNLSFESKYSTPLCYANNIYFKNNNEWVQPTEIVLPDTITAIGDYQFYNFNTVKYVEIPDSVVSIGKDVLSCCSSIESIVIPFVGERKKQVTDTNQYPFGYLFGSTKYDGGVSTGQYYYADSLTESTYTYYYIPESLTTITFTGEIINPQAFNNLSKIKTINFTKEISFIGKYAFYGCSNIVEFNLPTGITTIEEKAFEKCSSLTSINIPEGVTSIKEYAFRKCIALKSIIIPNTVKEIEYYAFADCLDVKKLSIPYISDIFNRSSIVNYLFDSDKLTDLELKITTPGIIGQYALRNEFVYTSIDLPEGITKIDKYAFKNNISCIIIPSTITNVDPESFSDSYNLSTIYFTGTKSQWDEIFKDVKFFREDLEIIYNYDRNQVYNVSFDIQNGTLLGDKNITAINKNEYKVNINEGYKIANITVEGASYKYYSNDKIIKVFNPTDNVIISVSIVTVDTVLPTQQVSSSIEFNSTINRTEIVLSYQIWEKDGIYFRNDKGTSNIADYIDPVRLYAHSSIYIKANQMSEIIFYAYDISYASALYESIQKTDGIVVSKESNRVVVKFTNNVDEFKINDLNSQVRLNALEVTYYGTI